MNILMQSLQEKLRFSTPKGSITTEHLFDLSLQELDKLTCVLRSIVEEETKNGYLTSDLKKTDESKLNKLKFEVAETILLERIKQHSQTVSEFERLKKINQLKDILATKEATELQEKDVNTLKQMIVDLKKE